jgi:hypothetical protein
VVARSRDFLARFRPVGTPGAAATAGVPVDRVQELDAELGPVLDSLAGTQAEAAAIRAAAADRAARRRRAGLTRADALELSGTDQALTDRTATLAAARAAAEVTVAQVVREARTEAAAIGERAARRLPGLVAEVVSAVRSDLLDSPRDPG